MFSISNDHCCSESGLFSAIRFVVSIAGDFAFISFHKLLPSIASMTFKTFLNALATVLFASNVATLWPLPNHFVNGSSVLWLGENTAIKYLAPGVV